MKNKLSTLITLFFMAIFLSGCNVYRQVTLPTPYYPQESQESSLGESATLGQSANSVQKQAPLPQTTQTRTPQVQNTITPIKENSITVRNKTFVQRIPFPEEEYSALNKIGNATVKGKIYAILPNGQRVYAKQTRLYLNPVTSYSTQWYKESYLGGAKMSKVDHRLFNYLKFTTSDNNGNFEFLNIPSGSYYLIGVIKCGTECGFAREKSIRVAKKINVLGDEVKEVELSKHL
jgi:hypothetical protein